jgi:SAM-dependent methyltransferase
MPPLPLWARALRGIDRLAWYAYHAHEITRDELMFAWLRPELRSDATVAAYSDMRTYLPGGTTFEGGLFGWEEALLARPEVPRAGRVLLAAAGGGRELKALLERGFEVTAFEPNPVLFEGASRVAAGSSGARVVRATYADLVAAVHGTGPLAGLRDESFDFVLFGWGSFTHLTQRDLQLQVLRAARALAPRARLSLSFFMRPAKEVDSRSARMRGVLRGLLKRTGARQPVEPGLGYDYGGGFVYSFTMDEVGDLAQQAGYKIEFFDDKVFPHVILQPLG